LAVRCIVQKSRPSSNVKVKVRGHWTKKRTSAAFCLEAPLWGAVLVRHFFGSGPWGYGPRGSTPVRKSAHAV